MMPGETWERLLWPAIAKIYDDLCKPWKSFIHLPSGYLTSPFVIGKPSISMGHLYHGYVSHNQRLFSFAPQRYPLVNVYIAMERSTMLSMGKSTISMAIFNSFFVMFTRGHHEHHVSHVGFPRREKSGLPDGLKTSVTGWCSKAWLRPCGTLGTGKLTKSYWKWSFIVYLPTKNSDFP